MPTSRPSTDILMGIISISTLFDKAPQIAACIAIIFYGIKAFNYLKERYWK